MNRRSLIVALALSALPVAPLTAQEKPGAGASRLTVERIYGAREFEVDTTAAQWLPDSSGYPAARWLPDSSGYLILEPSKDPAGGRDLVRYDPETGGREVLVAAADLIPPRESSPLAIDDYTLTPDRARLLIFTNSKRVWRQNSRGDYWVLDRASRELRKLGGDAPPSSLMFAKLAPGGSRVAYVRGDNLYVEDLHDGRITELMNRDSPEEINGTFDWVYEEEFGVRDGFRWSPDGQSIAFWNLNTAGVREYPLVNNTDSLYPRITPVKYPKVGEKNSACRVGLATADGRSAFWPEVPGDPREHYIPFMEWAGNSPEVVLQQFNRLQDTVRVMLVDGRRNADGAWDGRLTTILTEHDDAWVDFQTELRWINDGKEFLWLSERDGWRHAYRVSRDGKAVTLVTPGDFDVIQILDVDPDGRHLYFLASPDNPTQRYLYRVRLDGSARERITPKDQPGTHDYQISPDARWAIHRSSRFDTPPATELIRLPGHERVRLLGDNSALKRKLEPLAKVPTEFFRVDIGGGVELDAWCLLPPKLDPAAKYPLVVYVYGEPWAQTVLDAWGGTNELWHRMLAQSGYVVMSFDNRGTPAPRGRAWRKVVHRKMGILAPAEQAAALREVLRRRPYLDASRVGVWGWSGGGSMSLSLIFKYPDVYAAAIAIAPVSNLRHYDTIYQERYMGLPGDNVDGFTRGSPINFAHHLKGHLLLIHGTGDDNVHYQGTEALINELIRHDKPFTMMAYPNRSHAINEGHNTTLHLRQLMTRYLKENLPPGPAPARGRPGT
jgi:dipeptidyl-peptidase-4